MDWHAKYSEWLQAPTVPNDLKQELKGIVSETEQAALFADYLEFGTGGMRGLLGPGIGRMNRLTVRRLTTGYAHYLKENIPNAKGKGVVIQYDSRFLSRDFAEETAATLAGEGIQVFLSDQLRPTPLLSFLIREYRAAGGVMITASHNPAMYNGYKIYNEEGGQITLEAAGMITACLEELPSETRLAVHDFIPLIQAKTIQYYGEEKERQYVEALQTVLRQPRLVENHGDQLRIVYTSLHGAGRTLIQKALNRAGFSDMTLLWEQAVYDGSFPTVDLPNPEEAEALAYAIEKARQIDADIVFATDPDADRLGVAIKKTKGEYVRISGNQLGALLVAYLLKHTKHPEDKAVIKTIVTSDLGAQIARRYGCQVYETLTGFKYIGEKIGELEQAGQEGFLFGYEESYGFLVEPIVRDKDAMQAALLAAECALAAKLEGRTLWEELDLLYQEFGYYQEKLVNLQFADGEEKARFIEDFSAFKRDPPARLAGLTLERLEDYEEGFGYDRIARTRYPLSLPASPVVKCYLQGGHWFCIRLSGTEEKGKVYLSCLADSLTGAQTRLRELESAVMNALLNKASEKT